MAERVTLESGAARETRTLAVPTVVMAGFVIAALYFGRAILVPFALAVLLSFLLAPAVRWLGHCRVGRVSAVIAVVLFAFVLIFGFGGIVAEEVVLLGHNLPEYEQNIQAKIRSVRGILPTPSFLDRASGLFRNFGSELIAPHPPAKAPDRAGAPHPGAAPDGRAALSTPPGALTTAPVPVQVVGSGAAPVVLVTTVIWPLVEPLATGGLVLVFVVLILLKREDLRDRVLRLAGARDLHRTTEAMNDAGQRVSRYLLMQLVINATYGLPVGIGLALIGIPNAALWGMMAVLLRFIPYLGIVIAAFFPVALAVAVDPGWSLVLWTVGLFAVVELLVANIAEPWLFGHSTGLSSVAVIGAATFWTWLWGPIGLLLSTPLTVCLVVLGRHVPQLQFLDVLLGNEPVLEPEETFYQRVLANDPAEATEQAEEFAKENSISAFFDEVAIAALALAQADSDRGALTAERRALVCAGFTAILENLAEDDEGEVSEGPADGTIACIAGRNELDEVAASLLAHLLRRRGQTALVLSAESLEMSKAQAAQLRDAAVVCVSLISTASAARARYLVRRVRRRAPRARIVVGFWGQLASSLGIEEAIAQTSADAIVKSLNDAVGVIEAGLPAAAPVGSLAPAPVAIMAGPALEGA